MKELLDYDSETGIFTRLVSLANCCNVGDIAGYLRPDGYIGINVDGSLFLAHRIAWLYVYGYLPENDLDHKDRIRHHNWIDNLREVSRQCNIRNSWNRKNNVSGVKGVSWNSQHKKWRAQIMVDRKSKCLGVYEDFGDAVSARLAAEQCLDWSGCYSNSPAYKYVQSWGL